MEEEMTGDIQQVLRDEPAIRDVVRDAHHDQLRGQAVQDDIATLLDNHTPLTRLCRWEYRQQNDPETPSVARMAQYLVDEGYLDEEAGEAFLTLWNEIYWIVPAVSVQLNNLEGVERHWSGIELTLVEDNPEFYDYTLRWGVDERLSAEVPADRIISRCLLELSQITAHLQNFYEHDDVNDEFVSYLAEQYDLNWTTDTLSELLDDLQSLQHALGKPTANSPEPTVAISWDTDEREDPVVGTMQIQQPGQPAGQEATADGDGEPTNLRGFY